MLQESSDDNNPKRCFAEQFRPYTLESTNTASGYHFSLNKTSNWQLHLICESFVLIKIVWRCNASDGARDLG